MISWSMNSIFFLIARIVAAVMLFWALEIHPDSYYMFLRWIVFIVAVFTAFKFFKLDKSMWIKVLGCIIFAGIAVLFNPIAHIHLTRTIWSNADMVTAVLFLVSIIIIRK
ncbi:MAG: hypothetical protein A2287_07915 [Candidatus Melainabacteria bacterium RIFOXYA12_FULL_32_12]|nr:MAG: hypothetical protein A2104_04000 [Candidatus Melainabacteria bacterium GWF2_32_7]OGI18004.1 MAG: hypothetical protein A2255_03535 [Candidatus Melainabacteria bacterium RIFOXYA2_FULL_32_9]OGI29788.1 MAG: hypothetical protein A2287_07915 [Candidatus Melainabacteria bacterium RIFOXYA12_FULL_32_12]